MVEHQIGNLRVTQNLIAPIAAQQQMLARLHGMADDADLEIIKFGVVDELGRESAHETGSAFRLRLRNFTIVDQIVQETMVAAQKLNLRCTGITRQKISPRIADIEDGGAISNQARAHQRAGRWRH